MSFASSSLDQVLCARLCSLVLSVSMLYCVCSASAVGVSGYRVPDTHLSALFCIACILCWFVLVIMCSGTGGYSRMGRMSVLYSVSLMLCVQPLNLFNLIICNLDSFSLSRRWMLVPLFENLRPSIFASFVYSNTCWLIRSGGGRCLAIDMIWNLFSFVRIFHCFSNVFILSISRTTALSMKFLDLDWRVIICVMSSAYR